jgi:hypothetical protein
MFWSLNGIAGIFPGATDVEPLFNNPRPNDRLWYRFRRWLWDRVLITKRTV